MNVELFVWVRNLHVVVATLSIMLFFTRGVLLFNGAEREQLGPLRWLPHIIDTLLFLSGVYMAYLLHRFPGVDPWITTKLGFVLLYILLGMFAFRWCKRRSLRVVAWLAAIGVFLEIVTLAVTKQFNPLLLPQLF
jgi:uncharacterized membrane protein SirB2